MSSHSTAGDRLRFAVLAAVVLAAFAVTTHAQGLLNGVQVHGFGGWAYGETDGNTYLIGTADGAYDNADFALNITAEPMDKLSIVAQLRGEAVSGEDDFELDYAFASYRFSDALTAKVGRVKHPLGIYGEIFDVGTLRPLYTLPQSIYGPNGFTARAYNGIGVSGRSDIGGAWGLQYDVYGGQIEGDFTTPGLLTTDPDLTFVPEVNFGFRVNQTIGARVNVLTPVNGLSFGLSGFTGDDETELDVGLDEGVSRDVYVISVEYLSYRWSLRGEWGSMKRGTDFESDGGYAEAAFKITDHWQLAARYDTSEVTLPSTDTSQFAPMFFQLLDHEELALGVNYWFSTNLVVRLSYQQVTGNRHAFLGSVEEVQEMLMTGVLDDRTDLIVFGAQFSF